jgi:hypothetical protein
MPTPFSVQSLVAGTALTLAACGGGGAGAGGTGKYVSVADDPSTLELKSGGVAEFTMQGAGGSTGTYTVEGEKVMLTLGGTTHTLIKTGNCLEDQRHFFSKMCIGGKAGEAASAAASPAPSAAPEGVYKASSSEGEFTIEFKPGNTFTLTATPPGGASDTRQMTYTIEDRVIYAKTDTGDPLVLTFVNGGYETTSFGFALRFVKQ